jgi:hypothetical protein
VIEDGVVIVRCAVLGCSSDGRVDVLGKRVDEAVWAIVRACVDAGWVATRDGDALCPSHAPREAVKVAPQRAPVGVALTAGRKPGA